MRVWPRSSVRSGLESSSTPASAIWKWAVTPCWTDGQSDHAAIVASLHRRRTADSGVMSPHLVKDLPSVALNDLRSRFGLLERLFDVPNCTRVQGLPPHTYNRPRGPGFPPEDASEDSGETGLENDSRPDQRMGGAKRAITIPPNKAMTMTSLRLFYWAC